MTHSTDTVVDFLEIETTARALRAQATREMVLAVKAWVHRKFSSNTTTAAHNAA
jgi:hypothetical protein